MDVIKYEVKGLVAFGITLGLIALLRGHTLLRYLAALMLVIACLLIIYYQYRQGKLQHQRYKKDIKHMKEYLKHE